MLGMTCQAAEHSLPSWAALSATARATILHTTQSTLYVLQVLAATWDHLLLRTPQHIASTVCSAVLTLMQDRAKAPHHPPGHTPAAPAQPTGTTTSAGQHPDSMEAQQAATAAALSGPDNVAKDCDLAIALSVLGSKPGGLSQRCAMLCAAARAWPDDPAGVLGLMLLEDVVLGPGEAVIIPAGCPHAYICGESSLDKLANKGWGVQRQCGMVPSLNVLVPHSSHGQEGTTGESHCHCRTQLEASQESDELSHYGQCPHTPLWMDLLHQVCYTLMNKYY